MRLALSLVFPPNRSFVTEFMWNMQQSTAIMRIG